MKVSISWLKAIISLGGIGVILLRIYYPDLKIDAITLGLIIVVVLPWLSELIESAKFPGGWEVKFRDVSAAGQKVTKSVPPPGGAGPSDGSPPRPPSPLPPTPPSPASAFLLVWDQDSNLALVGLRIEIESRVRKLAKEKGMVPSRPLTELLRQIRQEQLLPEDMVNGLYDLVEAGNKAAHGARVQEGIATWAREEAPKILSALDDQLKKLGMP
jgi:hypothetical protein